ncbi:unnamed protein product [Durusdinium trenchii]|uniref:U-box domain-containing protein n=1 Tax=Durusdinium trenchii TaxID=1381693 RepID=A0ABP0PD08_9DINO
MTSPLDALLHWSKDLGHLEGADSLAALAQRGGQSNWDARWAHAVAKQTIVLALGGGEKGRPDLELVIIQALAAGIANFAESIQTENASDVQPLLEELVADLEASTPHLFLRLCRSSPSPSFSGTEPGSVSSQTRRALEMLCTWILTMLFRASGSLEPTLLCEWMGGDLLWALVLAKGILNIETPGDLLPLPRELPALQREVLNCVLQLPTPSVAFWDETPDGAIPLEQRNAELVQHRDGLAEAVLACGIQPSLVTATANFMHEDPDLLLHLVGFLASLHHPAPHLQVKDVEAYGITHAKMSAALAMSLQDCNLKLWCLLANGMALFPALLRLLRPAADLAFFCPPPRQVLASFTSATLAVSTAPRVLAALCVIAANASAEPHETPLEAALAQFPEAELNDVAKQWHSWRGPVSRRPSSTAWTRLFGEEEPSPMAPPNSSPAEDISPPPGLAALLQNAPEEFRCALDGRLMMDPVQTPQGHVFERATLAQALYRSGNRCPSSGEALELEETWRLPELRGQILAWVRSQPRRLPRAELQS